jgi:hypothetical protein
MGLIMKVESTQPKKITNSKPKKLGNSDIEAMLKAKFGDKIQKRKAKPVPIDKAELHSKKGVSNSAEPEFGDVKSNDPNSEMTQVKLQGILKMGGFDFNDKERLALSKILK